MLPILDVMKLEFSERLPLDTIVGRVRSIQAAALRCYMTTPAIQAERLTASQIVGCECTRGSPFRSEILILNIVIKYSY